jgi:hypothetical protein
MVKDVIRYKLLFVGALVTGCKTKHRIVVSIAGIHTGFPELQCPFIELKQQEVL